MTKRTYVGMQTVIPAGEGTVRVTTYGNDFSISTTCLVVDRDATLVDHLLKLKRTSSEFTAKVMEVYTRKHNMVLSIGRWEKLSKSEQIKLCQLAKIELTALNYAM